MIVEAPHFFRHGIEFSPCIEDVPLALEIMQNRLIDLFGNNAIQHFEGMNDGFYIAATAPVIEYLKTMCFVSACTPDSREFQAFAVRIEDESLKCTELVDKIELLSEEFLLENDIAVYHITEPHLVWMSCTTACAEWIGATFPVKVMRLAQ